MQYSIKLFCENSEDSDFGLVYYWLEVCFVVTEGQAQPLNRKEMSAGVYQVSSRR